MERPFDVIVFGATGFTGRKVAEYLIRRAPAGLRWAVAGRSAAKLEAVKAALVAIDPRADDVGTVEASVDDDASLRRMAEQTRVLVTTVGPFADYGEPVVRACVEAGTDYVDSTGEPAFVEMLLSKYGARAAERGVRLVPSSGFDAIVADLGAWFTLRQLPSDRPIRLSGYVKMKAVFSGGTEQSAIKSLGTPPVPPRVSSANGRRVQEARAKVEHRPEQKGWAAPFPTIDASVVVRSATSLPRYGPDFSYAHHAMHGSLLEVIILLIVFGSLSVFARLAAFRAVLLRVVKKSGEGPTEEQMKQNWFRMRFRAECDGRVVETEVSGGDPAYGETSKMLAESALCLAQDRETLAPRFGVLTPVEAMGDALLARLEAQGIVFTVLHDGDRRGSA